MTLNIAQVKAMISAVEAFPLADVVAIVENPTVDSTEQVVADVIAAISVAYPQAALATFGLEAIVWAIKHPAIGAKANVDPLGRGGRRK
jgi:hypothetical protein